MRYRVIFPAMSIFIEVFYMTSFCIYLQLLVQSWFRLLECCLQAHIWQRLQIQSRLWFRGPSWLGFYMGKFFYLLNFVAFGLLNIIVLKGKAHIVCLRFPWWWAWCLDDLITLNILISGWRWKRQGEDSPNEDESPVYAPGTTGWH